MRHVSIVLLALLVCATLAHADMVVPITFMANCTASINNGYYPTTDSGINHASVVIDDYTYSTIDCFSGTTDPARIEGRAWGAGATGGAQGSADGPMTIDTAPNIPAGTPLNMHVNFHSGTSSFDTDLYLKRGTTTLLWVHGLQTPSYEGDVSILAGETLNVSLYFGAGRLSSTHPQVSFQTTPEPASFILLLLPALLRRR